MIMYKLKLKLGILFKVKFIFRNHYIYAQTYTCIRLVNWKQFLALQNKYMNICIFLFMSRYTCKIIKWVFMIMSSIFPDIVKYFIIPLRYSPVIVNKNTHHLNGYS